MEPLTTAAIAGYAFYKFLDKPIEKFSEAAIKKMDELRKIVWDKLRGRSQKCDEALAQLKQGDHQALATVTKNLDVIMDEDEEFAGLVQQLAQEIEIGKIQDNSAMNQTVTGDNNTNIQAKAENGGINYNAQNINFYQNPGKD
jgi:hypothetical protein